MLAVTIYRWMSKCLFFRIELIFKLLGDCLIICDEASFPTLEKIGRKLLVFYMKLPRIPNPTIVYLPVSENGRLIPTPYMFFLPPVLPEYPKGLLLVIAPL